MRRYLCDPFLEKHPTELYKTTFRCWWCKGCLLFLFMWDKEITFDRGEEFWFYPRKYIVFIKRRNVHNLVHQTPHTLDPTLNLGPTNELSSFVSVHPYSDCNFLTENRTFNIFFYWGTTFWRELRVVYFLYNTYKYLYFHLYILCTFNNISFIFPNTLKHKKKFSSVNVLYSTLLLKWKQLRICPCFVNCQNIKVELKQKEVPF